MIILYQTYPTSIETTLLMQSNQRAQSDFKLKNPDCNTVLVDCSYTQELSTSDKILSAVGTDILNHLKDAITVENTDGDLCIEEGFLHFTENTPIYDIWNYIEEYTPLNISEEFGVDNKADRRHIHR